MSHSAPSFSATSAHRSAPSDFLFAPLCFPLPRAPLTCSGMRWLAEMTDGCRLTVDRTRKTFTMSCAVPLLCATLYALVKLSKCLGPVEARCKPYNPTRAAILPRGYAAPGRARQILCKLVSTQLNAKNGCRRNAPLYSYNLTQLSGL